MAKQHSAGATRASSETNERARPARWDSPHGIGANLQHLWRTSLPFRTILISITLVIVTVLCVGLVVSNTIANDLYASRVKQVLKESESAAVQAQQTFSAGAEADLITLTSLREQAMDSARSAAPTALGIAFTSFDGPGGHASLQDVATQGFDPALVTPELRASVLAGGQLQHYQPVELEQPDGTRIPGVIVGTLLDVPNAGKFGLYFAYSLEEAHATLDFVQRTLFFAMLALVATIGLIVGLVMQAVVAPIRTAAQVSRKLAAGHLDERIPESGEDDIATLARSFNEMADSLHEQINRLATLSLVQQRFVSDVSHELRTPLTTIRLAGAMLYDRRSEFDSTTGRSVELLHDQVERFDLLLSDLLEISRYDAGAVELLRSPNNLVTVAEDVTESLTQVALDHGTRLVLNAPGGYGDSEFDARRVTRIVRNLVGNAVEHGNGKPIVISVDSNETAVAVSVRDYGDGMTPEQSVRVFDRFWRADPSRKRTMGGTGLGLAIAKEDAALHDGQIDVWSEPGLGTNFRLTLPRTVGVPIEYSPLPLEPVDKGATDYVVPVEDSAAETFSDENVDTQPIALPEQVTQVGAETLGGESVVVTGSIPVAAIVDTKQPTGASVAGAIEPLVKTGGETRRSRREARR